MKNLAGEGSIAMETVSHVVTILGGTGIAVAALAWLSKSLLTHFMTKDIEGHKAGLTAQNALELEKLRAEFARQAFEHEVQFRRVDEKVAEHLNEVYKRLHRFFETVHSFVQPLEWSNAPPKEEKFKLARVASEAFWEYLLANRVYIPPRLYSRVHGLANKLVDIASDFQRGLQGERENEHYWTEAWDSVNGGANPLFSALVGEIQKRLGITDLDRDTDAKQ
jgi:hypothetical protein